MDEIPMPKLDRAHEGAARGAAYLDSLTTAQPVDDAPAPVAQPVGEMLESAVTPPASTAPQAEEPRQTTAQRLIRIAGAWQLFHDERGDSYAAAREAERRLILRIRGRDFRRLLARKYYMEHGGAPNSEAMQSALAVLEARAAFDGESHALNNRFAQHDGVVWIDLADERWRAVRVTAGGWQVVDEPPILFRRYQHQQPLPEPRHGGTLNELDGFLNVANADDLLLLKAWLVAAPLDIPRPALALHGPQGSGKTTAARVLRRLLDPTAAECISLPNDMRELAQVLDHHAIPLLDNVRRVGGDTSDTLCRAITGGAFSKRELFTDGEDVILTFRRAMILTGINVPAHSPDLLDRLMLIELERVSEDRRRDETAFWTAFESARPRLFGALLDEVASMLRSNFHADRLPRMADFALAGARWTESRGKGGAGFLRTYAGNVARQTEEAVESDCVGCALRDFMAVRTDWNGTPGELLAALNDRRPVPIPTDWPRRSDSLGRRLRILQATLEEVGISVRFGRINTRRTIAVQVRPREVSQASHVSRASTGAASSGDASAASDTSKCHSQNEVSPSKASIHAICDTSDTCDASRGASGSAGSEAEL